MNISKSAIVALLLPLASFLVEANNDFASQCKADDDRKQFKVELKIVGDNVLKQSPCTYIYSRCPFSQTRQRALGEEESLEAAALDAEFEDSMNEVALQQVDNRDLSSDITKYLGKGQWETEADKPFEWLETRTFFVENGKDPNFLRVTDLKSDLGFNCARALSKDKEQDFQLGDGGKLDITGWWNNGKEPLHITIVPFKGIINGFNGGKCEPLLSSSFDTKRSIAVVVSRNNGPVNKPINSIYCDVSKNPQDCLQKSKYSIDGQFLVLEGTLKKPTKPHEVNKMIDIFIPNGWDLNVPITSSEIRFKITTGGLNKKNCEDFVANPDKFLAPNNRRCRVDYAEVKTNSVQNQIRITGLGRINGYKALRTQIDYNYQPNILETTFGTKAKPKITTINTADIARINKFFIDARLLEVSSRYNKGKSGVKGNCVGSDNYSVHVNGPTVAWGSKQLISALTLNLRDTKHCARLHDVKMFGNWIDSADGPDLRGSNSKTEYTFTHVNGDNIKVAAPSTVRKHSTVLQGSAGAVVAIGTYEKSDGVENSVVEDVYVHRITHNSRSCRASYYTGGLVATRSCGQVMGGALKKFTLRRLTVAALESEDRGANSVGQPFGIGVYRGNEKCKGTTAMKQGSYQIRDLRFESINIQNKPTCNSDFYDDSGVVMWGSAQKPSVIFNNDKPNNFQCADTLKEAEGIGAVIYSSSDQKTSFSLCGNPKNKRKCILDTGKSNINFNNKTDDTAGLNKINIEFPTCPGRRLRERRA